MSKQCVTHHLACDCREEKFKELERENTTLRKAKDMVELERCEMMRTMSLLCNQAEQLQADKERLDWLGSQKDQPWLYWERPLRLTREAIDAFRKEAQP